MKTVCLIIPPSIFLLDERVFMHLGILRIAAVMEARGYTVEMLDLSGIENYEDVVKIHVNNSSATHFGITSTTPQMPATFKIAQAIKEARISAKVILGGPHITLVNAARKKETARGIQGRAHKAYDELKGVFDIIIAGDGEDAMQLALTDDAPPLIDADDPKSSLFLTNVRLDSLPFPARHLVDVQSYKYFIDGERALSLIAQLGCPFECGFCGGRASPMLRRIRMRSSDSVVSEIEHMYVSYGIKGFMLYDDELNVNPKLVEMMNKIRDLQDKFGVDFRLRGFVKAELFNDEQAKAMYKAGFRWLLVGFESGSPKILENINKKAKRDDNTRCLEIARRNNLKVKALMSIGHPGESQETIRETHDWLLKSGPDDFDTTIITTYPGTPYYDEAVKDENKEDIWIYTYKKTGDRLYSFEVDYTKVADYYKGDPEGGYKSYVYTDYLGPEELVSLRGHVESDVRKKLNIPFNPSGTSLRYEHSMGQFGAVLPESILKVSNIKYDAQERCQRV